MTERDAGQVQTRLPACTPPRQAGKSQVTTQNVVRSTAAEGGDELADAGHPSTLASGCELAALSVCPGRQFRPNPALSAHSTPSQHAIGAASGRACYYGCITLVRMCGIVGYVGQGPACRVVMDALRRMEYRGYDSSGIALVDGDGNSPSAPCRPAGNLEEAVAEMPPGSLAAPPAWATPAGRPTAAPPTATRTRTATPPARSPSSTTASSRTSPPCATSWNRRRGVRQRHRHRGRGAPGRPGLSPR